MSSFAFLVNTTDFLKNVFNYLIYVRKIYFKISLSKDEKIDS